MPNLFLTVLLSIVSTGCGSNILFVSDVISPSHTIFNFALVEGLVKKGHNVTFLQPELFTNVGRDLQNYHPIFLEGAEEYPDLDPKIFAESTTYYGVMAMIDYAIFCCQGAINSKGLDVLLNYPKDFKFDLLIFDATTSHCLYPLIKRFNYPPAIAVTAFLLPSYLSSTFGNALQPSYLPFFALSYTEEMSYTERVLNYFWINVDWVLRYAYMNPAIEKITRPKFAVDKKEFVALQDHISLLFCNLDPAYHYPQPLSPNIIPIAGLHVRPAMPLPKSLQQLADGAKDGLILFALGSNIRSDKLSPETIQSLLKAFGQIKQTVLWKFESNLTTYSVPKNVHVQQWLPQTDILAHPNTKLFISHGGALSTIEAAYFGVPVMTIPFIVDQYVNGRMIASKKLGVLMEYKEITPETVLRKMNLILQNPSYSKAMKDVSRRMRSQPQTALERAIFWSEYSIQHNGTQFLNPRSRQMSRFVTTSMDVHLIFIFIILIIALIIRKSFVCLLSKKPDYSKIKVN